MRQKLLSLLISFIIASSLIGISSSAQAYACRWVPGHWHNGYWHPAHRVCWGGYRYQRPPPCQWVGGHWDRYGRWHPAHQVCY